MNAYIAYFTLATIIQIVFCDENYHDEIHHKDIQPIEGDYFVNQFIVVIDGNENEAKQVASETNFTYKGKLTDRENYYHFTYEEDQVYERHRLKREDLVEILRSHKKVISADQQYVSLPTLLEIGEHEFKDVVCAERPTNVKVSAISPNSITYKGRPAQELVEPDDLWENAEDDDYRVPPEGANFDFEKLYRERDELMRRRDEEETARRVENDELMRRRDEEETARRVETEGT